MIRSTLTALVALGTLGLAGVAIADERVSAAPSQRVAPVRQNDLDLSSQRGASIMLQRLRRAANAVCDAPELTSPSVAALRAMEACRAQALDEAVRLLDAPMVTHMHKAGATDAVSYTH